MNNQNKKFHPIYLLAVLYIIVIYLFPIVSIVMIGIVESEGNSQLLPLALPLVFGIVNLLVVYQHKESIGRTRLLNCAILIKYSLIPFYVIGGLAIAVAILLMFSPVVIMVFLGPTIAIFLSVLGWIAMVGAAPFSVGYIYMSYKEKVHGKLLSVVAGIFQFFFTVDVISMMVLSLKEKRCVKTTIALLIVLILSFISITVCLISKIIGIFI